MDHLQSLKVFKQVVEQGAFNKAAERLGMPTSTVSKAIMDLEEHLRVKLLHRTTRKITVTQEGLEYYEKTQKVLTELQAIDAEISGNKSTPQGHLRIDCQVAFANYMLIPKLKQFQDAFPNITLGLGINDRSVDLLNEGIDCVIRVGGTPIPGMVERKIMDLPFITCASPAFLAEHGTPETPQEILGNYPTISYFRTSSTSIMPLTFKKGSKLISIEKCTYSCNNGLGLFNLTRNSLGIAQLARVFADPFIKAGEMVEILPDWECTTMPLKVVYPPNQNQSARLKVFIDWLLDTFRNAD
ncbi:LysR family transcriptional regulator [Vibrio porteresiae]|uniref:LysR family transcriptional regulator n=1 Tax=Vibrio porteresiae DSM 19223 TaxID=1123496 RepID=A0ABZ0QL54_9VIBR|nr:LysR family transcriptional regulator [Vibrio porteresiae]WPC76190.1 LysR family transcriptional regulator [Vibrio porteresiae DSM 19223]